MINVSIVKFPISVKPTDKLTFLRNHDKNFFRECRIMMHE